MSDQLDLLGARPAPAPEPTHVWTELEPRPSGKRYRFRLDPERLSGWEDRRDMHHPKLWYQPPFDALHIEYLEDGTWHPVRNVRRAWALWQEIRAVPGVVPA